MNDNEKRKLSFSSESFARLILSHESRVDEFTDKDLFRECSEKLIHYARLLSGLCREECRDKDHLLSKKCVRCEEEKSLINFYKQVRTRDGYGSYCKPCHRSYIKSKMKNATKRHRKKKDTNKSR